MREPTELEKQQYARLQELFDIGHQRYLDAGGDPHRSSGSLQDNDSLTNEERQELFELGRQVFGVYVDTEKNQAHCQGRTWTTGGQGKIKAV